MPRKLPVISGGELVKILQRAGFFVHHQKGSHIVLKRREPPYVRVVVPAHRETKRGLLRVIISEAGLTREEFLKLYEE